MIVFTVTVIDIIGDSVLGIRRTPAIYTKLVDAISIVKNNDSDIADNNLYQYAVIEETVLNRVRPNVDNGVKLWFKYNGIKNEFEQCDVQKIPSQLIRLNGFGIG
jgi:hypothetical protein